jgi:hypothetical protein
MRAWEHDSENFREMREREKWESELGFVVFISFIRNHIRPSCEWLILLLTERKAADGLQDGPIWNYTILICSFRKVSWHRRLLYDFLFSHTYRTSSRRRHRTSRSPPLVNGARPSWSTIARPTWAWAVTSSRLPPRLPPTFLQVPLQDCLHDLLQFLVLATEGHQGEQTHLQASFYYWFHKIDSIEVVIYSTFSALDFFQYGKL